MRLSLWSLLLVLAFLLPQTVNADPQERTVVSGETQVHIPTTGVVVEGQTIQIISVDAAPQAYPDDDITDIDIMLAGERELPTVSVYTAGPTSFDLDVYVDIPTSSVYVPNSSLRVHARLVAVYDTTATKCLIAVEDTCLVNSPYSVRSLDEQGEELTMTLEITIEGETAGGYLARKVRVELPLAGQACATGACDIPPVVVPLT